jgi:hypothetical protein
VVYFGKDCGLIETASLDILTVNKNCNFCSYFGMMSRKPTDNRWKI